MRGEGLVVDLLTGVLCGVGRAIVTVGVGFRPFSTELFILALVCFSVSAVGLFTGEFTAVFVLLGSGDFGMA